MKIFKLIGFALLAILICLNFTACSNNDNDALLESEDVKEYMVSLGVGGEVLDIEYKPLSRAVNDDLYGIQVYSSPIADELGANYTPYAFGLFDSVDNLSIKLLSNNKYKFIVTLLVNGKNILANYGHYYRTPFDISDSYKVDTPLNSFMFTSDCYFMDLSTGRTELAFGSYYYSHPTADRYYGELSEYKPSKNGKVQIDLKRVVFGVKYMVEGMDEGNLRILMNEAPVLEITSPNDSTENIIYTFSSAYNAYVTNDYEEEIPITFIWVKNEEEVPQGTFNFLFKRKQITKITIKINDNNENNGFDINTESGDLGNGENLTIENETVVETPIE